MNRFWKVGPRSTGRSRRPWFFALFVINLFFATITPHAVAQNPDAITIHGTVTRPEGQPVSDAAVTLQRKDAAQLIETRTDAGGAFVFPPLPPGTYSISAEKAGQHSQTEAIHGSSVSTGAKLQLILNTGSPQAGQAMEFSDQPNFTVAGVTDWTAVGGHGSDATLRTSEDLARETAALTALDTHGAPDAVAATGDVGQAQAHLRKLIAQGESAGLHRELAEVEERAGDPLAAVHEYQQAVRLEPSEQNYFAWGSELLLHRAVWQAVEVLRNGNKLHPQSARMLTALGAALFAGDLFDEAAASLCAASDLEPSEATPYTFMGRVMLASPTPLPCVQSRLARFAEQQPGSASANYLYAMAIKRDQERSSHPEPERVRKLLNQAIANDPRCADAWLQLGILADAQHRTQEAMGDYSRAIEADPQSGEAHYRLAVAYDRTGAAENAQREFQLHDEIERSQASAVERQRKEVKQFLVVLQGQPSTAPAH